MICPRKFNDENWPQVPLNQPSSALPLVSALPLSALRLNKCRSSALPLVNAPKVKAAYSGTLNIFRKKIFSF